MEKPISGAELTRTTLIDAAIRLFAERGYDAVSTRDIADLAAANIGSIAYHFGGKPGLRLACAEHVMANIAETVGTAFLRPLPPLAPDQALDMFERTLRLFCNFWLVNPGSRAFVGFMLREMLAQGEISEHFYTVLMKPMHMRFCELFALATGRDTALPEIKIAVFSIIGQVLHFRVGQPLIMRRLEWDQLGEAEARLVAHALVRNARAIILDRRSSP
jgi:AcrR family transcriptional regulator